MTQLLPFVAGSALLLWLSRRPLRQPGSHGFYRFFAWECILGLVVINRPVWGEDPYSPHQFASWLLMLASIGLDRTRYLITNLIPWRPPGNRNPTDAEVLTCLPFLLRHIALVRPRRLVLLGKLATQALTGSNAGITRMRGKWLPVTVPGLDQPVPALPMLHPAYLLRNAGAKREAWSDLLLLRRTIDSDVSS